MNNLVLNCDNGTSYVVNPHTLLVFLDETGEESFNDPNAPFFGFGGIVIPCRDYFTQVELPWHKLKTLYFDGPHSSLHASDIGYPGEEVINAFNEFFDAHDFGRIAVTSSDRTIIEIQENIEAIIAALIWDRVKEVQTKMGWSNISDILVLIEENPRLIPALQQEFISKKIYNQDKKEIKVEYNTILKDPYFAGLEVADFVIHTAGRQARIMRNHLFDKSVSESKPDFRQMFEGKNGKRSSYLSLSRIRKGNKN